MTSQLETSVDLTWWRDRSESWIRFGRPVRETVHDRRRRTVVFAESAVFAWVRWAGGDYGTTVSEVDVLQAAKAGRPLITKLGLRPGAEPLLTLSGWPRVRRVFSLIDAIEALGLDPSLVAPDYWRHVHNRLLAGLAPRPYTLGRHRAWLMRRETAS